MHGFHVFLTVEVMSLKEIHKNQRAWNLNGHLWKRCCPDRHYQSPYNSNEWLSQLIFDILYSPAIDFHTICTVPFPISLEKSIMAHNIFHFSKEWKRVRSWIINIVQIPLKGVRIQFNLLQNVLLLFPNSRSFLREKKTKRKQTFYPLTSDPSTNRSEFSHHAFQMRCFP